MSRSRSRKRSGKGRSRGPSTPAMIREVLSHRVVNVADPSEGAPAVDYAGHPWISYAELVDVFTPPQLDAEGNPIKPEQKEWREDARSLKGWTDAPQPGATANVEMEFKL